MKQLNAQLLKNDNPWSTQLWFLGHNMEKHVCNSWIKNNISAYCFSIFLEEMCREDFTGHQYPAKCLETEAKS